MGKSRGRVALIEVRFVLLALALGVRTVCGSELARRWTRGVPNAYWQRRITLAVSLPLLLWNPIWFVPRHMDILNMNPSVLVRVVTGGFVPMTDPDMLAFLAS